MRRTIPSLLLSVSATLAAQAGLEPQVDAPLYRHMLEVNAQWRTMDPALGGDARAVHFSNEAERIARHLHLVAAYLRVHVSAGTGGDALERRNGLLLALDAYADRGVFPRNYVLPCRNPVFIDPHGTACAVGQMMIESGHHGLAERIDREQELGHVAELLRSPTLAAPISAWALEHGFTAAELAWIQPAYGPEPGWTELGNGTNGLVTTLLPLTNGGLLVAGTFNQAGGQDCRHVALWNGSSFQQMGNGLNGRAECAVEYTGMVIVGGSFQGGLRDIAYWDGSNWTYGNAFPGMFPVVHALHLHGGRLYAAGSSSGFAGVDHEVRKLSGHNWVTVGEKLNGSVHAMATYWGALTIGGDFTGRATFGTTDSSAMHVAQLVNGGWQQLTNGLDAPVYDLELLNGELYAGGDAYNDQGDPVFGFARQPLYGTAWEPLVDPNAPLLPAPGYTRIHALHTVDNAAMYIGGRFGINHGAAQGKNFAVFHPNPGILLPSARVNTDVADIATQGGEVVFGGAFTTQTVAGILFPAFTSPLRHIAIWSPGGDWSVRSAPASTLEIGLLPNPATEDLTITYTPETTGNLLLRDALGRTVYAGSFGSDARRMLDVSNLAPGLYSVVITDGGNFGVKTFVKQ